MWNSFRNLRVNSSGVTEFFPLFTETWKTPYICSFITKRVKPTFLARYTECFIVYAEINTRRQ